MTQPGPVALVVDDEPDLLELLELTLRRMSVEVVSCINLSQARKALACRSFDLCFTDMRLPDGDGLELVREIGQSHPQTAVAVITAYGSADAAVSALKAGAFDFVAKPVELSQLRSMVGHALKLRGEVTPAARLGADSEDLPEGQLLARRRLKGDSEAMRQVRATILKLARSQAPVFISGESGVGKELAARLIHEVGPRTEGPFIAVNCGAVPSELMESEFFGHLKGAFTGATSEREGLFRSAQGGTLFLDEVADLPLHMQVKLLRTLQEKVVRPIGASREVPIDVRVLSASHKDLAGETNAGRFRQDLYYRINVIELSMPSLRQRPEDIVPLAQHLLEQIADRWEIDSPVLDDSARSALQAHDFPGNVRELENILERAVTLAEDRAIRANHLDLAPGNGLAPCAVSAERPSDCDLETWLADLEAKAIMDALEDAGHNKTKAAELLGVSFRSLRYKIDKLGLE